ncbi:MAG TPA: hypothetical protein VHI72_14995 [Hyphomicrobiaceae bacterium]|nr:hypothetical protein [Hyphomicrobiaceae bacterium]
MLGRMFRVVFGFVLACLAAGLTLVLFVYTPLELAGLAANGEGSRLAEAGLLALAAATHTAVFSAPFALLGAAYGEWRGVRSPAYYALVGILIAALGFFAQYRSEAAGELSILNTYALSAFVLTGFVAGLVYWLCTGRASAGPPKVSGMGEPGTPDVAVPQAKATPAAELSKG